MGYYCASTLLACVLSMALLSSLSLSLNQDGEVLLELKYGFNDTKQMLRSWRETDPHPCGWVGISCSFPHFRVQSINLPYMQLGVSFLPALASSRGSRDWLFIRIACMGPSLLRSRTLITFKAVSLPRSGPHSSNHPGVVPPSIGGLAHLRFLNLSTNFLSGEIPNVGVLKTFGRISSIPSEKTPSHFLNGIIIGSMSTMALAFVALLACDFSRNLPYTSSEIIKQLELLDEDDVVGSGGFGTVYKMMMDDSSVFAVKRIDRNHDGSDQIFERELEILGSIKHINLVNLRGYCRLPSAKLLIYDYVALGSLDQYLHESGQEEQPLNWNARMKIALGSARGLAYLHHDCSPAIVHRDIKSSNILLDMSLEPHVSDFGLAKLLVDEDAHVTTVVAGTFGYLAPEYLQNGRVTEKSDVYSFGVLLLELVNRKEAYGPLICQKRLEHSWLEHRLEEIVDERCGSVEAEAVEAILDIAAMCTAASPEDRPSMSRVLKMLEEEILSPFMNDFYEPHLDI
uniref:Protein kinase domain-containing protein n=1 Tax=Ananas comosus var. bracteatus TaxID=296719 RepID=A0A6V7PAT6_ANACO|nr:unnamed protein product [Ananas comosus var. bracteatus]